MLKSVIPRIKDWPINLIAQKREKILQECISEAVLEFNKSNPTLSQLRNQLQKTLYLENIRIKNESWEVDPEDEREFWGKIKKRLLQADPNLVDEDVSKEQHQEMLQDIMSRYANEIIGHFNPNIFWFARQLLVRFFARLFNSHFGGIRGMLHPQEKLKDKLIVAGPVEKLRNLSLKGTVILVPTHFSNLDSAIIGFGMDYIGMPAFQYGAGLNLFNSKFFSFFMGNLGAYKLDRRKKNPIYLETLKSYSKTNVLAGAHTIFFPGGTRSRAGNIETELKLGLLGTVMEAQRIHFEKNPANLAPKIFIVPLTLSYNFVLEASSLIEDQLKRSGKEQYLVKEIPTATGKGIWKFFWETFSKSTDITLSLSEPMDVFGNALDDDGNSIDKFGKKIEIKNYFVSKGQLKADDQREMIYTQMLGDKIIEGFFKNNVVYSSHVVTFVAFELINKQLDFPDLFTLMRSSEEDREINFDTFKTAVKRVIDELYMLNNKGQIKLSPFISSKELDEIIELGITNVCIYHTNLPIMRLKNGNISSEDLKLLYYYHNRLLGYGLQKYI
ncbi:MAG: 1-acyl-sn-glycerol-3-phosphate acyltransferase [Chitinophagales bacterium]|nr:1-acyl-sn-glycerol-3-phosphate acyltransferase [Chitinophagales bacterium]HMV13826.1 1-acyl-sn-glycerol-3-phosphate acyltransferase [Chitinophagales bacterium]HMW12377.1 1-acyl-sn-glycerol-3-phosphate acyltransferase [Chitinophagales bacterium]HMX60066.1 1-acyl-sn-glycerol-3-phosphate acyltransferase [Chitinophagales bacterium]HMY23678.1 1-acyl-sn-glycerol-3-phosphate acyltransferase [Chitinophagales bacterium]